MSFERKTNRSDTAKVVYGQKEIDFSEFAIKTGFSKRSFNKAPSPTVRFGICKCKRKRASPIRVI